MREPLNACMMCNRFKRWEDLTLAKYTPDTEFTAEEIEFKVSRLCAGFVCSR